MTNQELQDLKERLRYVVANGFEMACMEKYAEDLAELGADMPEGDVTPVALLAMADSVGDAEAKPKAKKESPAPAPKKSSAAAAKAKKDEEAAKAKEESKPAEPAEEPKASEPDAAQEMKAEAEAVKEEPSKEPAKEASPDTKPEK